MRCTSVNVFLHKSFSLFYLRIIQSVFVNPVKYCNKMCSLYKKHMCVHVFPSERIRVVSMFFFKCYFVTSPLEWQQSKTTRMKAKKKKRQVDFQKVKLKVGKTKPKANNATNTTFRTKGIYLSEQLKKDTSGPTTHRQLGINVSSLYYFTCWLTCHYFSNTTNLFFPLTLSGSPITASSLQW